MENQLTQSPVFSPSPRLPRGIRGSEHAPGVENIPLPSPPKKISDAMPFLVQQEQGRQERQRKIDEAQWQD